MGGLRSTKSRRRRKEKGGGKKWKEEKLEQLLECDEHVSWLDWDRGYNAISSVIITQPL